MRVGGLDAGGVRRVPSPIGQHKVAAARPRAAGRIAIQQMVFGFKSEEYGLTSEIGVSNESIIWDNLETRWMGPEFSSIKAAG